MHSDGYLDAEKHIQSLEAQVANAPDELAFLCDFIRESCFDEEICRDQLRALWTAFCIHRDYNVDTHAYDTTLLELWAVLRETGDGTSDWSDFDSFDNFMCAYLV